MLLIYIIKYLRSIKNRKNKLILLALGAKTRIFIYNLYKAGYQIIDIGILNMNCF